MMTDIYNKEGRMFNEQQKSVIKELLLIEDYEQRFNAVRTYCQGLAKPLSDAGYEWARVASTIFQENELKRNKHRRG